MSRHGSQRETILLLAVLVFCSSCASSPRRVPEEQRWNGFVNAVQEMVRWKSIGEERVRALNACCEEDGGDCAKGMILFQRARAATDKWVILLIMDSLGGLPFDASNFQKELDTAARNTGTFLRYVDRSCKPGWTLQYDLAGTQIEREIAVTGALVCREYQALGEKERTKRMRELRRQFEKMRWRRSEEILADTR